MLSTWLCPWLISCPRIYCGIQTIQGQACHLSTCFIQCFINKLLRGPLLGTETCLHKSWVPDLFIHQKRARPGTMRPKVPMDTFEDKIPFFRSILSCTKCTVISRLFLHSAPPLQREHEQCCVNKRTSEWGYLLPCTLVQKCLKNRCNWHLNYGSKRDAELHISSTYPFPFVVKWAMAWHMY